MLAVCAKILIGSWEGVWEGGGDGAREEWARRASAGGVSSMEGDFIVVGNVYNESLLEESSEVDGGSW
jgi:hypothetical protein